MFFRKFSVVSDWIYSGSGIVVILSFSALRLYAILLLLKFCIDVFISSLRFWSLLKKAIGNELIDAVATVERSISAHITNQLAWISIPASKVLVIIFFTSKASLPTRFFMIDHNTNATKAKLAKFFIMFQIFQR